MLTAAFISMLWCGLLLPRRRLWIAALVLAAVCVFFWGLYPRQTADMFVSFAYLPIAALVGLGTLALAGGGGFAVAGLIRERQWTDLVKHATAVAISLGAVALAAAIP